MKHTRRDALGLLTAGTVAVAAGVQNPFGARAPMTSVSPLPQESRPVGSHAIVPLPFDPKKLEGLSERLIVSHHENNYSGAVKNLNKVEIELARMNKETPAFVLGAVRERELMFRNSAALHELYFGNLG